jgi:ABC-type antimicrobial peptide transport system permease subunit
MIRNYFKTAFRNLLKNKISTLINIVGLSAGIAVAILTGLWLYDELSFDTYHENYARIAKVSENGVDQHRGPFVNTTMSYPLTHELMTNYRKDFKRLVRASFTSESILSFGDKRIARLGVYMDEDAPDMFTLKMLKGTRAGLKDMHSILLSQSLSKAIFGSSDPMGKTLLINNSSPVIVTGIYEDLPYNTELTRFKFIAPFALWVSQNDWIEKRTTDDWMNHYIKFYAEIPLGATFESVDKKIANVELDHIRGVDDPNYRDMLKMNPIVSLYPMSKWHLDAVDRRGGPKISPRQMVWLVSLIGAFVLLLACINFMNLSTARSEKRAREVGIRKAIGSARKDLIFQFFSESLSVVAVAYLLALVLALIAIPWFNQLADKKMNIPWTNPYFWFLSVLFILTTGTIAGSYPAIYLSSFKPIAALKGSSRLGKDSVIPRKILVVFQFAISVILINCTIIILRQVRQAQDRPVGYSQAGLIMVQMKSADFYGKYDLLRTELLRTGVVAEFAESMGKVTELASNNGGFDWEGRDPKKEQNYGTLKVSPDYGRTVGWQIIQGRDFSRDLISDSTGIIINESAAREMDLKNPIGKQITWTWWMDRTKVFRYTILGVVKDLVVESPYEQSKPVLYYQKGHNGDVSWMLVKVKPSASMQKALSKIETVFRNLIPSAPFDFQFADEDYGKKFSAELRMSKLAGFFAAFAIFISSLGLFGLASFTAEQRTKEIGVRKVLGASTMRIWRHLSGEFLAIVSLSIVIAIPVSYYFMYQWTLNFQYRAALSAWIFILAGAGAIGIALLTVSLETIRAAQANPVKSLRSE